MLTESSKQQDPLASSCSKGMCISLPALIAVSGIMRQSCLVLLFSLALFDRHHGANPCLICYIPDHKGSSLGHEVLVILGSSRVCKHCKRFPHTLQMRLQASVVFCILVLVSLCEPMTSLTGVIRLKLAERNMARDQATTIW
jgi:hypothetical protein